MSEDIIVREAIYGSLSNMKHIMCSDTAHYRALKSTAYGYEYFVIDSKIDSSLKQLSVQ
jgi:hypothetical protein